MFGVIRDRFFPFVMGRNSHGVCLRIRFFHALVDSHGALTLYRCVRLVCSLLRLEFVSVVLVLIFRFDLIVWKYSISILELLSDQENRNGFTVERLWFLGHRVESTPFRHLEKFRELSALLGHVFTQAKYPAVQKSAGKVLLIQRIYILASVSFSKQ